MTFITNLKKHKWRWVTICLICAAVILFIALLQPLFATTVAGTTSRNGSKYDFNCVYTVTNDSANNRYQLKVTAQLKIKKYKFETAQNIKVTIKINGTSYSTTLAGVKGGNNSSTVTKNLYSKTANYAYAAAKRSIPISITTGDINAAGYGPGVCKASATASIPATTTTKTISGNVKWADDNNRDGLRSARTVTIKRDGTNYTTKSTSGAWSASVPVYKAGGGTSSYTVTGNALSGYTMAVSGYNITYTHTPARTSHSCTVKWEDDNNRDGLRPSSVSVQLLKNGAANSTASATAAGSWACTFSNLYKNESGKAIAWTSKATAPTGYTANGTTLTHTPERKNIEGKITWTDSNDHAGYRPQKITVTLLKNGEKEASVETDAAKGWAFSFADQYVFESGAEIKYTISVPEVDAYKRVVSGTNVTYTYFPGFDIRFGFSI